MRNTLILTPVLLIMSLIVATAQTQRGAGDASTPLDAIGASLESVRASLFQAALKAREIRATGEALADALDLLPEGEALTVEIRNFMAASTRDLRQLRDDVNALTFQLDQARAAAKPVEIAVSPSAPAVATELPAANTLASHLIAGEQALATGALDDAMESFLFALTRDPDSVQARLGLARVYFERDELDAAQRIADDLLSLDQRNPRALGLQGAIELRQGDLSNARRTLTRSVRLDDSNAVVHNHLGAVFFQQKKYRDALTHFRRAVELDPGYLSARYNLAVLLATGPLPDLAASRDEYKRYLASGGTANPALAAIILGN